MPKNKIEKYFSLVKFSHTIFAMPFAFIGYFIAIKSNYYEFNLIKLLLVVLCMIFARNAAMSFNRYIDRKIDLLNPRTKVREIPQGLLKASSVLWFVVINSLFFIFTTFFINSICFYLSPVALLVVLGYSATKRFTSLCHLILGLGLSLAPIGAYLAVSGKFTLLPIIYSFVVLCWVSGFDIIYALQDEEFDKSQQLHSIPSILGKKGAIIVSTLLHICSAILVIIAGLIFPFGWLYWIGSTLFIGLLIYQHLLVKPGDLSKINAAFFTSNGIASVIFATFTIIDLLL